MIKEFTKKDNKVCATVENEKGRFDVYATFDERQNLYRSWVETSDSSGVRCPHDMDKIIMEGLSAIADAGLGTVKYMQGISEWAESVCRVEREMELQMLDALKAGNTDGILFVINNSDSPVLIEPCGYEIDDTLESVEYYMTDSNIVEGYDKLCKIAEEIVNYDALVKDAENEKLRLQKFYDTKIRPIEEKPAEERTDEEEDARSFFSNWHRDVYGHRPHTGRNECAKFHENADLTYYTVRSYYDGGMRGLADMGTYTDWREVVDFAHNELSVGSYVRITNDTTGQSVELNPDDYDKEFNGEFPVSPEDLEEPDYER